MESFWKSYFSAFKKRLFSIGTDGLGGHFGSVERGSWRI